MTWRSSRLRSLRDSEEVRIDGVPYALHCKGGPGRPVEAYSCHTTAPGVVRAGGSSAPGHSFEVQFRRPRCHAGSSRPRL